MQIKLGFSYSDSYISRFIRWVTSSPISHTFLWIELDGKEFVAEASFTGFRLILKRNWDKDNIVYEIVEPIVPLDKGWESAEDWLGEAYGWKGLIGYGLVILARKLKRQLHNPFHEHRSLFCSEANAIVIQDSGWPGSEKLDPASMSPADLFAFLKGTQSGY